MKHTLLLSKVDAIEALGGTPNRAAKALGYKAVQSVYAWPDVLPLEVSDRVRGAWLRLNPQTGTSGQTPAPRPAKRRTGRSWLVRSGRAT